MSKKLQKDTKENVSDIIENPEEGSELPEINGGRTVIVRDPSGEVVLSSTHEDDTLKKMFNLILNERPSNKPIEPGAYHG